MMSQENEQQTKQPEMTKKQREEKNNANTVKSITFVLFYNPTKLKNVQT